MLRFEDPIYLWFLWILPVLALIRFIGWRRRHARLKKLGDPVLLRQLMPGISKYRPTVKFSLLLAGLGLVIVMLARPQMGSKISHEKRQGIETIICLDISNSMLAEDVVPSRLDKSKMLVENLVDNFTNDKIGLVVFAGDAFVQLPITSDYVSAKMFLQNISPSLIQTQGTNIAQAIDLASKSFTQQNNVGRAIIVITDGENHEPGATEAAAVAKKKGINVFILGIGNTQGAPIPTSDGGYLKDNEGNTVMTALNEQMCKELAQAGSGQYIHVDNTSDAEKLLNDDLTKLQKGDTTSVVYSEYDEQFQAVGILVILLLMIEICILDVKNPLLRNIKFFGKTLGARRATRSAKQILIVVLLLFVCTGSLFAQNDRMCIREGNKAYHVQKWAQAETQYRKALSKNNKNPQALYNLGCALMMQQKDSMAMQQYQQASQLETNKMRRSKSFHNMGVIMQNHREYAQAIECYKNALRCNPQDNEARYNLALCQKLMKSQPQQNDKNQNKHKDKNKNDNKDKEDQDKKQNKNKNKNKDNDKNKDRQNQQNKQEQDKMSRDNAEQLLNAAVQQEKATKQRMQKAMSQPKRRSYEKNW